MAWKLRSSQYDILMALTLQHLLVVVLSALSIVPAHPISALAVNLPTNRVSDDDSASLAWLRQLRRQTSGIGRSGPQIAPAHVARSMQGAIMMPNGLQQGSEPAVRHVMQCWAACNRQSGT